MLQICVVFAEEYARELLVFHAVFGAALVAVTTHLVLWLWPWLGGKYTRQRGVKRFATLASALFLGNFLLGCLIYPVYKTRVRLEYLENPDAIKAQFLAGEAAKPEAQRSKSIRAKIEKKISQGHSLAAWFDIKEHWVGLALALSLALTAILRIRPPDEKNPKLTPVLFGLAFAQCSAVWFAAVVGLVVSAFRSIAA